METTKQWNAEKYIKMYHLDDLIDDKTTIDNVLSYLRLRDELSDLYNSGEGRNELKQAWLANILVLDSSVIEALLYAALAKVESNCKRIKCQKISKCSFFITRNSHSSFIKNYSFINMTEELANMKILTIDKTKVDEIRELRNNIHIYKMDFNLSKSKKYSATSITEANNLIKTIADNLFQKAMKIKMPPCMW